MTAQFVAFDSEITKLAMCQDNKSISADGQLYNFVGFFSHYVGWIILANKYRNRALAITLTDLYIHVELKVW